VQNFLPWCCFYVLKICFQFKSTQPAWQKTFPTSSNVLGHVDDPSARDGGGTGHGKIVSLKDHVHSIRHWDCLTVEQAQFTILIKHSVHVFDPGCFDWAIKHDPLTKSSRWSAFAEHVTKNAIGILLTYGVKFAEQLTKTDTFWVDLENLYQSLLLIFDCPLKCPDNACFASQSRTNNYDSLLDS